MQQGKSVPVPTGWYPEGNGGPVRGETGWGRWRMGP